jgi:DNA helicase-2/ATP-dependent DNA helicase PcrA
MDNETGKGIKLDSSRKEILKSDAMVRLVQGEPGVGKTWFGCELAQYELSNPSLVVGRHQKILFLTFARNAVARIRQVFTKQTTADEKKKKEFTKRVRIETFAGFFWWLVDSYGRYAKGGSTKRLWLIGSRRVSSIVIPSGYIGCTFDELEEIALRLVNIWAVRKLVSEIYPLVIVDEFQDVHERLFEIIAALGQESRMVLLRGQGQCIYRNLKQFDPEEILEKCRKKLSPREYTLPAGQGEKQRFCQGISDFVNRYKNGEQLSSLQAWPIRLKSVPKVNTRGNPNQLETFAALELRDMRGYLNRRRSTIAVLANTNLGVSKIHKRVREGSTSYRLGAQGNSLFFGDNILLQYGRLMLRVLKTHWVAKRQKDVSSTEEVAVLLAMLFQEHDTNGNYPAESLMGLAKLFIDKAKRQHAPKDGSDWECCLTNNLSTLNRWLRATQQELRQKGISNCPGTAFDEGDNALLETLAREFILSVKGSVHKAGRLNIEKATRDFEKANQQKVIFEKLGLQKNVQVMTIHKSKGREFDGVVLVLEDSHKAVWRKNGPGSNEEVEDIYRVAITRARSAFALVAFEDARKEAKDVVKRLLPTDIWIEV